MLHGHEHAKSHAPQRIQTGDYDGFTPRPVHRYTMHADQIADVFSGDVVEVDSVGGTVLLVCGATCGGQFHQHGQPHVDVYASGTG